MKKSPFRSVFSIALLLAVVSLTGCGRYWIDPYITVKQSQLNWVQIQYYDMAHNPIRRVGVTLYGTGLVEVRKGTSDLVSNDFAARYRDAKWSDYRTRRFQVDPMHLNDIFQNLVNYGLLDREKTLRGAKEKETARFIAVKANISNYTYSEQENIFNADPELAEQLLDTLREFDSPAF